MNAFAFSDYIKLIPHSAAVAKLQYMIFEHTFPRKANNSHLLEPTCPFIVIEDDEEWRKAVKSIYPIDKLRSAHGMSEEAYLKFERVIDENQYKILFDQYKDMHYI
jgi:hypothetical protein